MKKLFFVLFCLITLSSCTSERDKLLKQGETFLQSQLKDPSSFQLIESNISDTITVVQNWKKVLKDIQQSLVESKGKYSKDSLEYIVDLKEYNNNEISKSEKDVMVGDLDIIKNYKNLVDDFNRMISNPTKKDVEVEGNPNDIRYIDIIYKYRAKNGFGAYNIETTEVVYDVKDKTFKTSVTI